MGQRCCTLLDHQLEAARGGGCAPSRPCYLGAGRKGARSQSGPETSEYRRAGLVAVALTVALLVIVNPYAWIAIVAASLGALMTFLPPMSRFFRDFASLRNTGRLPYRRPERIFYGRLPRFR